MHVHHCVSTHAGAPPWNAPAQPPSAVLTWISLFLQLFPPPLSSSSRSPLTVSVYSDLPLLYVFPVRIICIVLTVTMFLRMLVTMFLWKRRQIASLTQPTSCSSPFLCPWQTWLTSYRVRLEGTTSTLPSAICWLTELDKGGVTFIYLCILDLPWI